MRISLGGLGARSALLGVTVLLAAALPFAAPGVASAAGTNTVSLAANPGGLLKFTKSKVSVASGKVTIKFTNASPLAHDLVLINSKNKVLGQTPVFQGGTKSSTVKLTAGKYIYYCSVPGHRQAGMQGTLTVT
jgi:plastocyanin